MKTEIVSIDQLLLDPNNYRIHSHERYVPVEEKNIGNPMVQKRVQEILEGENRRDIKDLIESFKTNGYLRIDNILVRKYDFLPNRFVVIEGNRRIATLKALKSDSEKEFDIGKLSTELFSNLEIVIYEQTPQDYLLLMGLRHVSGVKEWGDYEQSELIMNLHQQYNMDINEISKRLGMGKSDVKRRINSFIALEKYKEDEEYGENFKTSLAAIFYELMSKPELRDWLGWDEKTNDFLNKNNLKRFFSWISPTEERESPIIEKRDEIRQLSKFIRDKEALDVLEEKASISEALETSTYYTSMGFKDNIRTIKRNLDRIPFNALLNMDDETKKDIEYIVKSLNGFIKILGAKDDI